MRRGRDRRGVIGMCDVRVGRHFGDDLSRYHADDAIVSAAAQSESDKDAPDQSWGMARPGGGRSGGVTSHRETRDWARDNGEKDRQSGQGIAINSRRHPAWFFRFSQRNGLVGDSTKTG